MLKRQNIKSKVASGESCLLLLLLAFAFLNPIATSAYADEIDEEYGGNAADFGETVAGEIETYAGTASTVGISFSPASGSASLSPATSAGQSAQIKVLATISVKNSGGYSVYIKSNSQNLVGQASSSNTIPGMQGSATYANLPVNTWGYYAAEGNTVSDNASYKAISTSGNGDKITENTSKSITSDTKTIALSFAARINDAKPADTYRNTVTMSVVSSPMEVTFASQGVTTMQGMTFAICNAVSIGQEAQLKDARDGKFYWVSKLADGNCWMTQNLDLDLSTSKVLASADTDVTDSWTPASTTLASASGILLDSTSQRSWSLGNYRITNPNLSSDCGKDKNSAADCMSQFTAYTTPTSQNGDANAHYILGNHYAWNAATAGTGGTITGGQASSSVCPKGWRLPTSAEYTSLVAILGGTSSTDNVTNAPFYGVRGGDVAQKFNGLFETAGDYGDYWSSTPESDTAYANYFFFTGTSRVNPSYIGYRQDGHSVRCVAR